MGCEKGWSRLLGCAAGTAALKLFKWQRSASCLYSRNAANWLGASGQPLSRIGTRKKTGSFHPSSHWFPTTVQSDRHHFHALLIVETKSHCLFHFQAGRKEPSIGLLRIGGPGGSCTTLMTSTMWLEALHLPTHNHHKRWSRAFRTYVHGPSHIPSSHHPWRVGGQPRHLLQASSLKLPETPMERELIAQELLSFWEI